MSGDELLMQLRSKRAAELRAFFPTLAERDLMQILCSNPRQAVYVLQRCFGCDMEDAKATWNEYVLRYVDGTPAGGCSRSAQLPHYDHFAR